MLAQLHCFMRPQGLTMLAELQGRDGRTLDVLPPTLKSSLPDRCCCPFNLP